MTTLALAVSLGLAAGVLSGLFGVGGGILFVPTLVVVLDIPQLEAQATSLAAIVPVVAVGIWRQRRAGVIHWRTALVLGVASVVGVAGGVALAESLSDDLLRKLFALLVLAVACRLAWSVRRR